MRVVDLTAELYTGAPVYPGDPPIRVEAAATIADDGYAVASLALSDQAGTHVETQAHFLAGGRTLDQEPLERFIGRASVVDVPCRRIAVGDLAPAEALIARNRLLLLRSGYSTWRRDIDPSDPGRPTLPLETLRWLVARGVRLLGIDAFDFDAAPDYAGHRYLLERNVLIVEGLVNLAALTVPEVPLYVVPLRVRGTGGAPCRVFATLDP
ncbi:MAG TPA: cyclase family protein [Chloroflexota bacterium]|nr:cyclase family protein [Chloroflexota bacterium]